MQWNRRQFTQKALTSAAALALARGLTPGSARGQNAVGFTPYLLFVHCSGGWDPTMVFDGKTGNALCAQEDGATAAVGAGNLPYVDHPNRPGVKSFFDTYGVNAAIVNGLTTGSMVSRLAVANEMTFQPAKKFRRVDWLSYYVASLNPILDLPHAILDAPYIPGEYTQVAVRLSAKQIEEYLTPLPATDYFGADAETALANFHRSSFTQQYLEAAAGTSADGEKLRAYYYGSAREIPVSIRTQEALTALGPKPDGESAFLRNGKLAVELFAGGLSQAVTLQCGADQAWDTTTNHFARQAALYEELFAGLVSILQYAAGKAVAEKMIIVVTSDLGRAPQLNAQGGKGPWPFTSALLWGPGIRGGTVAGLSDAVVRGLPVNPTFGGQGDGAIPLTMANIMAGIYLKTDVPVTLALPDVKPLASILLKDA